MENLFEFQEFVGLNPVSEGEGFTFFPKWKDGGILLIKGIPLRDGLTRLYATRVKNLYPEGLRGFFKALSYGEFFIVMKRFDGGLEVEKIPSSPEILQRAMGLKSQVVPLNAKTGKTPLWQDSVSFVSFPRFLEEFKGPIENLPDIFFPSHQR